MISAVLLDAFGTLVELEPPAPRLARAVGADVADCERAFAAEIAYYRAHMLEGRDRASLADLRSRCAAALGDALGRPVTVEQLVEALSFRAFPEVPDALARLRGAGLRLVVVSNWDAGLDDVLRDAGLLELVDGIITSAACGVGKPAPQPFRVALTMLGVRAAEVVHVGDSLAEDVEGARAAGITPVLVVRGGAGEGVGVGAPAGAPATVTSLTELPRLIARL